MRKITPKENMLRVINHDNPEYIPYELESIRAFSHRDARFYGGNGNPGAIAWTDAWGTDWKLGDVNAVESFHPVSFPLKDLGDLGGFPFPNPSDPELFDDIQPRIMEMDRESELLELGNPGCMFTRAWLLRGMENFLSDMLLDPAGAEALLDAIYDYQDAIVTRQLLYKPDMVYFGDDAGTTTALIMDPRLWRRMIKPRLAALMQKCRDAGAMVFMHCCGHIEDIVDDFVEMGVKIMNPVQASANDLKLIKDKTRGKIALMGGIDSDFIMRRSPGEVAELTRNTMRLLGEGGGYIAAPDQQLPFPEENIRAIKDTVASEGRY
jgi:uroporphyrinogen decarboxylase